MQDGTYLIKPNGDIVNYGERWAYGFFVANGKRGFRVPTVHATPLDMGEMIGELSVISPLVGVWTDSITGVTYIDPVTHVSDYDSAVELGRDNGELAIWDAFKSEEIYLADL